VGGATPFDLGEEYQKVYL